MAGRQTGIDQLTPSRLHCTRIRNGFVMALYWLCIGAVLALYWRHYQSGIDVALINSNFQQQATPAGSPDILASGNFYFHPFSVVAFCNTPSGRIGSRPAASHWSFLYARRI